MVLGVKILLVLRFAYCLWKYRVGRASGANLKDLIADFGYIGFVVYLFLYYDAFTSSMIYLDSLLVLIVAIYSIEMMGIVRRYFLAKDFGLNPEKRVIYFVEYFKTLNQHEKVYHMLRAHFNSVKNSSKLLIYLGEAYQLQGKFENAYECFVEATELTEDENLLITAGTKAYSVCANELKDPEKAKVFIKEQIIRDISSRHIQELEKLIGSSAN